MPFIRLPCSVEGIDWLSIDLFAWLFIYCFEKSLPDIPRQYFYWRIFSFSRQKNSKIYLTQVNILTRMFEIYWEFCIFQDVQFEILGFEHLALKLCNLEQFSQQLMSNTSIQNLIFLLKFYFPRLSFKSNKVFDYFEQLKLNFFYILVII